MDIAITIIMILFPINWGKREEERDTHLDIYLMLLPWQNFMLLNLFITKTPQWRPGETISSAFHRETWYRDSQKSGAMLPLGRGSRDLSLFWTSFFLCVPSTKYPWVCHNSGVAKNPNSKCQDGQAPCKDAGVGVGELAFIFWLVEVCVFLPWLVAV